MISIYMRDVLLYDERASADIYHSFMMLCYVSAIVGGVMGNVNGKYEYVKFTQSIIIGTYLVVIETLPYGKKS